MMKMMKTLAILFLVLLPCVWTQEETVRNAVELNQLSKGNLIQIVNDATKALKKTAYELHESSSLSKRKSWGYNLGHGFRVGGKGLTYTNGNFRAYARPSFTGGTHRFGFSYRF